MSQPRIPPRPVEDWTDEVDQAFLALDYGHTGTMARAKLMDARKLLNTAKQIASQPDPQDDKTCRQILGSLDELMAKFGQVRGPSAS